MRRDRRRRKQGERLGAILGLLAGGVGGILRQSQLNKAAELAAQKEAREAKTDEATLELKERELRGQSNRAWQASKRDEMRMGLDRQREKRMEESAEVRADESAARIRKIEHDISTPDKGRAPSKTQAYYGLRGMTEQFKTPAALRKHLTDRMAGIGANRNPNALFPGMEMQAEGAERRSIESMLGMLAEREDEFYPPQEPTMSAVDYLQGESGRAMRGQPQQEAPQSFLPMQSGGQPAGGMQPYGPPAPTPQQAGRQAIGLSEGPYPQASKEDLAAAYVDAMNPQNPPEIRMGGWAKIVKYFPSLVPQSFKNMMGGQPVPGQMPR